MANEKSFTIEAAVKCEDCDGKGCQYCRFKGFNRDPVEFVVDEDDKVIRVNFL
jgi:hypothetical protein